MATAYSAITDDFDQELGSIRLLIDAFDDPEKAGSGLRICAANAATLLLAATFEEFVRAMAKEFARGVVRATQRFSGLPGRLATRAWRRTMETLGRLRVDSTRRFLSAEGERFDPQARFDGILAFCTGDLSRDIYDDLIFNENNMRVGEINSVFGISGLSDVCRKACGKTPLMAHFGESDSGKTHVYLVDHIENFFARRNEIAHALNPGRSSSPELIRQDIATLQALGRSLLETLEAA